MFEEIMIYSGIAGAAWFIVGGPAVIIIDAFLKGLYPNKRKLHPDWFLDVVFAPSLFIIGWWAVLLLGIGFAGLYLCYLIITGVPRLLGSTARKVTQVNLNDQPKSATGELNEHR